MMWSEAIRQIFFFELSNIYLQHVLHTIIYFMKIQSQNIYLKNTLDPYHRSVGPPDIYRPYAKSEIS